MLQVYVISKSHFRFQFNLLHVEFACENMHKHEPKLDRPSIIVFCVRQRTKMEIMEDGNLVDRVRILLQRDMQYYQVPINW